MVVWLLSSLAAPLLQVAVSFPEIAGSNPGYTWSGLSAAAGEVVLRGAHTCSEGRVYGVASHSIGFDS